MSPLLQVDGLVKDYLLPRESLFGAPPRLRALHGVSFRLAAGQSLGVVGESGCGKSTLARLVMALDRPTAGRVAFDGQDLFALPPSLLRRLRRGFQMVFQDPYGSLDPRHRVSRIVAEPLTTGDARGSQKDRQDRVAEALGAVGLKPADGARYPHEFSGGQRQRIAIARAIITRPRLLVADEPVSALDVSVQAQVLNLLMDLQDRLGLTTLVISHDLAVVHHLVCDLIVMYQGRIVEAGPTRAVFRRPRHPYTRMLLDAVPRPDPSRRRRGGRPATAKETEVPNAGCPFAPRCTHARTLCREEEPPLLTAEAGRRHACHFPLSE